MSQMFMEMPYGMPVIPAPADVPIPPLWADTTTVMMRNLPNKYTQRMLLTEINEAGFLGTFDFLYLPIDPETAANRGYAFLNFIDPGFAWMFKTSYEGRKMNSFNSTKVVSVVPATLQGFDANYAHYSSARVNRGDPAARPLFLREPALAMQPPRGGQGGRGGGAGAGARRRNPPNALSSKALHPPSTYATPLAPAPPFVPESGASSAGAGESPEPQADAAQPPRVARFCPECGGAVTAAFKFCPHCGANIGSMLAEDAGRPI